MLYVSHCGLQYHSILDPKHGDVAHGYDKLLSLSLSRLQVRGLERADGIPVQFYRLYRPLPGSDFKYP